MRTITLLTLMLAAVGHAAETAQFLKIGVGARAIALGGATTALIDDISALSENPAGLAQMSKREAGAMHADLGLGTRFDFLGYAHPLKWGTLGLGGVHLSQGAIQGRDADGHPTGGFSASDTAANLSFAAKLGEKIKWGAGVKFISSRIAEASAQALAFDLGGMYALGLGGPGRTQIGLAVQNMGTGMRFKDQSYPLPLTVAMGVGYRLPAGLTLALDYKRRPYSDSVLSVGTEYAILPAVAIRMGSGAAGLSSWTAGVGLKLHGYSLDYALTPFGNLGNAQRFSLGTRF